MFLTQGSDVSTYCILKLNETYNFSHSHRTAFRCHAVDTIQGLYMVYLRFRLSISPNKKEAVLWRPQV
jgi:hypothetical protein